MNNIDMILQSADLPESPVDAISDERQAKILSGALQLARQDAKKRSRRRAVQPRFCTTHLFPMRKAPITPRAWSSVQTVRRIRIPMIFLMTRSSASTRRGGRQAPTAV